MPEVPDIVTTGPIVACDNAIEHYTKHLELAAETRRELERKLVAVNDSMVKLDDMREQWRAAKQALQKS